MKKGENCIENGLKGRKIAFFVMWIRIRSDPHSFGSEDPDPEAYIEKQSIGNLRRFWGFFVGNNKMF